MSTTPSTPSAAKPAVQMSVKTARTIVMASSGVFILTSLGVMYLMLIAIGSFVVRVNPGAVPSGFFSVLIVGSFIVSFMLRSYYQMIHAELVAEK